MPRLTHYDPESDKHIHLELPEGIHNARVKIRGANVQVTGLLGVRYYQALLKRCSKCEWAKDRRDYYEGCSRCKLCHNVAVKDWQKRNPEKVKKCRNDYNERCKQARNAHCSHFKDPSLSNRSAKVDVHG